MGEEEEEERRQLVRARFCLFVFYFSLLLGGLVV